MICKYRHFAVSAKIRFLSLILYGNVVTTLFPINWKEPFGRVMIESMACESPVIDCEKKELFMTIVFPDIPKSRRHKL